MSCRPTVERRRWLVTACVPSALLCCRALRRWCCRGSGTMPHQGRSGTAPGRWWRSGTRCCPDELLVWVLLGAAGWGLQQTWSLLGLPEVSSSSLEHPQVSCQASSGFFRSPQTSSGHVRPPQVSSDLLRPPQVSSGLSGFFRSPQTSSGLLRPPQVSSGLLRSLWVSSRFFRPPAAVCHLRPPGQTESHLGQPGANWQHLGALPGDAQQSTSCLVDKLLAWRC